MLRSRLVVALLTIGVLLDLVIGVVLIRQLGAQAELQQASTCWNRVLVAALHDQLTAAGRVALLRQAGICARLTR